MGKNIVLCFDGTRNEYGERNTNVVSLFSLLKPEGQALYYDPGVGTFSALPVLTAAQRSVMKAAGLAFGHGLASNVQEGYRYLMEHHERGDKVFLFGFSRGAYTARVLAGLVYMCGLLPAGNENLIPYAYDLYRRPASRGGSQRKDKAFDIARGFKGTFSRRCGFQFVGLWDTVSSIGWFRRPAHFPYTRRHPSIQNLRHAVALDERRAFYRQNLCEPVREAPEVRAGLVSGRA